MFQLRKSKLYLKIKDILFKLTHNHAYKTYTNWLFMNGDLAAIRVNVCVDEKCRHIEHTKLLIATKADLEEADAHRYSNFDELVSDLNVSNTGRVLFVNNSIWKNNKSKGVSTDQLTYAEHLPLTDSDIDFGLESNLEDPSDAEADAFTLGVRFTEWSRENNKDFDPSKPPDADEYEAFLLGIRYTAWQWKKREIKQGV